MRVRSSAVPKTLATKSVTPIARSCVDLARTAASSPTMATSAGPGRAFAVEHRLVRRQRAVDRERRGRGRARAVGVVGDADREAGADHAAPAGPASAAAA